ncbi:MAG: hypothetical protein ACFCUI_06565 [Bernardetiaceae bacterium]
MKHLHTSRSSALKIWLLFLGLSISMAAVQGQEPALLASHKTQNQSLQPGEVPDGVSADDWASIQQQIQMRKYKAYPRTEGGYASANPAHGLQITYAQDGSTVLTPRNRE